MADYEMFNLTAFADQLVKENRKLDLANKITSAVGARSIQVDLMIALETCDALAFSLDHPMNQPPQFREASEAALMSYIVLLYARATKTTSKVRKQYDLRSSFTPDQLKVHTELCDLRDNAVAHFGKGGSYVGNWIIELAVMDVEEGIPKAAVMTRRQTTDRSLLARARAQIESTMQIIEPVVSNKINAFIEAINIESKADPEFYKEIHQHPLNQVVFLGGEDQVEKIRIGRKKGTARGAFGHN